jgi:membrane protease YdiL (CAAX protease family)
MLAGLAVPFLLWVSSLAIVLANGAPDDLEDGEIIANLILQIVLLDGIFIGVPVAFALVRYRLGWGGLGLKLFDRDLWWLPIVAAAAAHVAIIIYSLLLIGVGGEGAVPEQEGVDELFDNRAILPLAGLALLVFAPLAEELFFRGFLFAGLIRYLGVAMAMVVSGLLFSMFHVTSLDTLGLVLPFTVVGALFAWLYYRTGSLWTSMSAHFVFNLFSFVLLATGAASS